MVSSVAADGCAHRLKKLGGFHRFRQHRTEKRAI